ncbi:MAG: Crp/Fnr family transcriptional regulator [Clostridiales bacterium]|nr:Crp/Fnr family transcriptional regulator [Clostridiales bacterium]
MEQKPAISVFQGVSDEDYARMLACFQARRRDFAAGETILDFNENSRSVGLLVQGSAVMERIDVNGHRMVLEHLDTGELFGELIAFTASTGDSITVTGRTDCRVLFIDYNHFLKRCERACPSHSIVTGNLLRLMGEKAYALSERIEVLGCTTIREKLMCYFRICCAKERSDTIHLAFTMRALAEYLCVNRSAMVRELSHMKSDGLIQLNGRQLTVL